MKKIFSIILAMLVLLSVAVPFASAASALDTSVNVAFTVACTDAGYEFEVYKVADLKTSTSPHSTRYDSLIDSISDSILNGDTATMLSALDGIETMPVASVGSYAVDTDGYTKTFENLTQGIYYVRATNYPAGVKSVTNSVFALPYYTADDGWVYTIDTINLAEKTVEDIPEIAKTITNSTKDNVNFTDVSLGDTVEFELKSNTAGSTAMKLTEYIVTDTMSAGFTLDETSIEVALQDTNGAEIAVLDSSEYSVDVTATEGEETVFVISLSANYLQDAEFYGAEFVSITYSATLNEYSLRGVEGNPNTVNTLKYTNKNGVSDVVNGNTVYAYTYGVEVNKFDDAGNVLAGAEFALYLTSDDAKDETNAIATGTSNADGKVKFFTPDGDVIRLASGNYFIKETKAPTGYNKNTDVIPVVIEATYGDTLTNNTYVTSAPENGVVEIAVKNSRQILPQTGGNGAMFIYIIAGVGLVLGGVFFIISKKKKSDKVEN